MNTPTSQPKKRGRKPGVKTGPQVGSRPWHLLRMVKGDCLFFASNKPSVMALMGRINSDIHKNNLTGKFKQTHFIAVQPSTKEVLDLVRVERIED